MEQNKAQQSFEKWLNYAGIDSETKAELEAIKDNETEIVSRFYGNLTFGTAGLRGVMAAGTARMNIYTVMQATQGLCNDNGIPRQYIALSYCRRSETAHVSEE